MKTTAITPHKSSLGVDANLLVAATLVVLAATWWIHNVRYFVWIIPLIVFFIEKESAFVKSQACMAAVLGVIRAAVDLLLIFLVRVIMPSTPRSLNAWMNLNTSSTLRRYDIAMFLYYASIFIAVVLTICVVLIALMAFLYRDIRLPLIGSLTDKVSAKLTDINVIMQNNASAGNATDNANNNTVNNTVNNTTNNVIDNATNNAIKPVFCGDCGAKNNAGTNFCSECGHKL